MEPLKAPLGVTEVTLSRKPPRGRASRGIALEALLEGSVWVDAVMSSGQSLFSATGTAWALLPVEQMPRISRRGDVGRGDVEA